MNDNLCQCGCGQEVTKLGNKYLQGHVFRNKENRKPESKDINPKEIKQDTKYNSVIEELYKEIDIEKYIINRTLFNYIVQRDIVLLLRDIKESLEVRRPI